MAGKEFAQVGVWGKKEESDDHYWSFLLEKNHKLKKITIDHGDVINSLMFTTQDRGGSMHNSKKFGGRNGGDSVSEVTFVHDEVLIGINGTTGIIGVNRMITSLSFVTNKRTYSGFGRQRLTHFTAPWDKGSFAGFYGFADCHIDGIGVYLLATEFGNQIARVGTWGQKERTNGHHWSFRLEKNHYLKKITVGHGDVISSLTFTSQDRGGSLHTSKKFGGRNGDKKVSQITFDGDEELIGINGTTNTKDQQIVVSSLSFVTTRSTYKGFGDRVGTPFTVPWDEGSFGGFYGVDGNYINGIGVYLNATI